jgi:ribosomal protein S18 acetylase RimI-like enzyme
MTSIEIRCATRADANAVGRFGAGLLRAHYDFDCNRFMKPQDDCDSGYASFLSTQLDDPDALVLVAEDRGEVVGYLYAAVEPRNWKELRERAGFVHDIFVDAGRRASGIGNALLDAAFAWMRERRIPRVILGTAWSNELARRLFERRGFRPTKIVMSKELGE